MAGAGWLLGHTVQTVLGEVRNAEVWAAATVIAIALALAAWRRWHSRRHSAPDSRGA